MKAPNGFKEFSVLFSQAGSLPQLPGAAMRLIQVLDQEDVQASEVERIVLGDPALTGAVIKAASSALFGGTDGPTTTVRGAITRLGLQAVQAVAVSLGVQALLGKSGGSSCFDKVRFARHSIFVGFLSRYLYACRVQRNPFVSQWSRDELFAVGVLHELGIGLLARVDPPAFERVFHSAKKHGIDLHIAFNQIYGEPISKLSVIACDTWKLPPIFSNVLSCYEAPESHQECVALSCVNYADYLAQVNGYGLAPWPVGTVAQQSVVDEVGLPEKEIPGVVMLVARHTGAYVPVGNAA